MSLIYRFLYRRSVCIILIKFGIIIIIIVIEGKTWILREVLINHVEQKYGYHENSYKTGGISPTSELTN